MGDEAIESSIVLVDQLPEDQISCFIEILWRLCRACLWMRTVYQIKKDSKKTRHYVDLGLKYTRIGLSVLKDESPTYSEEILVTRVAPMYKWAGSIVGISAEVVPGINDKIKAGFESLDLFVKAAELDEDDYITVYNIARWHWEIVSLSGTLKRAANWVSARKYVSTVDDVLRELDRYKSVFPYKYPFLEPPPDIPLLYAYCYKEKGKAMWHRAKEYAIEVRRSFDKRYGDVEDLSVIDEMTDVEINALLAVLKV